MTDLTTPVVFVTANVGSIFEDPTRMVHTWAAEFLSTISRLKPKFVALHCQEVGGKNYEKSMQYVDDFVKLLMASEELQQFSKMRIYLDKDFSSADKFTALGNFYFIHDSLTDIAIYDFVSRNFVPVEGVKIHSDDIDSEPTKEKSKFPLEFFPECKWSRKGFLRTRWSICGTAFDLVNIHLFHDASNFVAIESFPSEYSETRRQALTYTLDRFRSDEHGSVPVFIFGDFNFRTDTKAVVNRLSAGLQRSLTEEGSDDSMVDYSSNNGKVLSLGKKTFSHLNHQDIFADNQGEWLREFDKELESFRELLFEFDISFQPTYPFEEGETGGKRYMQTRCPAWCDRVLLTKDAVPLVNDASNPRKVEYGVMGRSTCMGDHKPVYLKLELNADLAHLHLADEQSEMNAALSQIRGAGDTPDRSGLVKRVNSASAVESRSRREDWQSNRCNSDVSWNPTTSGAVRKRLLHGTSRIRLVTPNGVHSSLPRLTSHHSSSDEEWFEIVDGEDDVLEMKQDVEELPEATCIVEDKTTCKDNSRFSIFKRLSKKESHIEDADVFEAVPEVNEKKRTSSKNIIVLKTQTLLKSVRGKNSKHSKEENLEGSWESIDLGGKETETPSSKATSKRSCCVLQ